MKQACSFEVKLTASAAQVLEGEARGTLGCHGIADLQYFKLE
jgi:hypothetical protein